jgi:hypothetical protein
MIYKNLSLLMLLFVSHSALPMEVEAGFTPNKELENAVKSHNKRKVERILAQISSFTENECKYYRFLMNSEGSVFGIRPDGNIPEVWFLPTATVTPVLLIFSITLGAMSAGMRKIVKGLIKPSDNAPKIDVLNFYASKPIYYSLLTLTGVSILGTIGFPAHFLFHAYYSDQQSKISRLLSNKVVSS